MNRPGTVYVATAAIGYLVAFAMTFGALSVGLSIFNALIIGFAIVAVTDVIATMALRRPPIWRALCLLVTLPFAIFGIYGGPLGVFQVVHGRMPGWVVPGVFVTAILTFALAIAAHLLTWRFFTPKASA